MSKDRVHELDDLLPNRSVYYDSSPGVYLRSDKDRELDALWQGFKINSKETRSAGFYLTAGFITGALCTVFAFFLINFASPSKDKSSDLELLQKANTKRIANSVNIAPSTETEASSTLKTTEYVVKSGDTLGAIAYKFYGTSNPAKVERIQAVNNMKTPDDLQVDQKLIIPMED